MLAIAAVVVAWAAAVVLPGWLVSDALRPGAGRARNAALAPVVGLGTVYLVAQGLQGIGLPVMPSSVVPVCIIASALLWVAVHRPSVSRVRGWRPVAPRLPDGLGVTAAAVLGCVVWIASIHTPAVLPNTDGAHHALFAWRIQALHFIDPGRITSPDGIAGGSYYPLALHVAAAVVAAIAGVPSGTALTVAMVLASSVALPMGVLVLVRRIDGAAHSVAGISAVMVVLFAWFPYSPIVWGGIPTVVGMCLIPATVDGLFPRQHDGPRLLVGVCVGIGALGLFQVHNPELIAAAAIALVLVPLNGGLRSAARRTTLTVWSVSAVVVLISSVSALKATFGLSTTVDTNALEGGNARLRGTPSAFFADTGISMVEKLLSPPILALSLLGLTICVLDKRCRGMGIVFLLWLAVLIGTAARIPVIVALSTPWFQAPLRLSYYLALPLVIWAAVGLEKLGVGIGWGLQRIASGRPIRGAAGGGAAVLLAITVALQAPSAVAMTRDIYRRADLIGADQLAAFNWLRTHVAKESRVLNVFDDGSGWMGILGYAQPLFATKPEQGGPDVWGDRWHLLTHAGQLATDSIDQAVVRKWHVEFAYTDSRHFPGTPPLAFTARTLDASPAYALVWSRGSVQIFRVLVPQTT